MRHLYALAFLLPFAAALPRQASAQNMVPVANEFRVNQNVPSDQYLPQLAVGPSDDYVVVWKSWQQDDNTASIYFRRYNSNHIALSNELLVATGLSYQETHMVKIIYWTDGKFIIGWNDPSGLNMRVLNPNNSLDATVPLGGGAHWDFAVRGNTLALLYGTGNDALHIRGYDLGTNAFINTAVLVTEDPNNDYEFPNIRFKNDGTMVAVYGRGNYPNRIYRKTFDADFLAQINETIVHDQNSSLSCIDVSTNASDELLISTKWGVNGTDVYTAWLLDGAGNIILDDIGVFSCSYAYYTSECALFDNGDFVIVMGNWLSLNDTDDYEVRGRYFSNYGAQSTGIEVMNTTTPDRQTYPAVEKRSDGSFIVVWEGNGFQGDVQGINARAYSGATFPGVHPVSSATMVVAETGTQETLELRLGTQPTGDVVIDLSLSDDTEASIDVLQMTFTTANWNVPQPVVVTGLDDLIDDGDVSLSVVSTMNAATADVQYAAMGPESFPVTNLDDDAIFSLPLEQSFCRSDGLATVNIIVSNNGSPVGDPTATSSDQSVVDDADISVTQVNATTFSVTIGDLLDNVVGSSTITVTVSDANFSYSGSFLVTTVGPTPVITQNGSELSSTPGLFYQWFLDGAFIPGADEQTYIPTQNGVYTVLVIDADGCSTTSEEYNYTSTGIASASTTSLWVGPLTDVLPLRAPEAGHLRILDAGGKTIYTTRVVAGMQSIALPYLAPGIYTVLVNEKAVRVVKE